MPNDKNIADRFSEIGVLISDAKNLSTEAPHLEAHIASYVCVLLTGALEYAIERLISLRVEALRDHEVHNYVTKAVAVRFRNPNWRTINDMLGEFSDSYQEAWRNRFPANSRIGGSLHSISNIKNNLAHTGASSLLVTLSDVDYYLIDALSAIDYLEGLLAPSLADYGRP